MRSCLIARSLVSIVSLVGCAAAQSLFDQAPPSVDAALRERVRLFYQAQVAGKLEEAAKYVAEDSKDLFAKPRGPVKKFEVTGVTWSDGFTQAKVAAELDVAHPQGLLFPEGSFWKLEKGQWVWWIPAEYRKKGK